MSSAAPEPVQNLTLCISIMTLSGFLRVVATMVLAFPDFLKKSRGSTTESNKCLDISFIFAHILLLTIAAVMSILGTIYGPVSIAVPVQTGSQLLFNVIAMGVVLQMRAFDKAQRVGTYVVVFSVLSLIDVGPGLQDGQDILKLLSQPDALVWSCLISISMIISAVFTLPLLKKPAENSEPSIFERCSFFVLTVGVTMSNVGMATAGKTLGILTGSAFGAALVYYLIAAVLGLIFSVVSATRCDQGIFTPLSSVALILVNMLTGIIVWEDYKVIDTWIGYMSACFLMSCGVYLLAEVDALEKFWRVKYAAAADLGPSPIEVSFDLADPAEQLTVVQSNVPKSPSDVWHDTFESTSLLANAHSPAAPPVYNLT